MATINKTLLLQTIADVLRHNIVVLQDSSRKTRSAGNDDQSQAEGKYDTRSTEENYLADGFALQAQAAVETLAVFQNMRVETFDSSTPIHVSALVQVEFPTERAWFLLAPVAGGIEVTVEDTEVTVLSLDSPLGSQLIGLKAGDPIPTPPAIRILSVE